MSHFKVKNQVFCFKFPVFKILKLLIDNKNLAKHLIVTGVFDVYLEQALLCSGSFIAQSKQSSRYLKE